MRGKLDTQIKEMDGEVEGLSKRLHYLEVSQKNSKDQINRMLGGGASASWNATRDIHFNMLKQNTLSLSDYLDLSCQVPTVREREGRRKKEDHYTDNRQVPRSILGPEMGARASTGLAGEYK